MGLTALSRREANIFVCVSETVVAPGEDMPRAGDTDAVAWLDETLVASPRINAIGIRALLYAVELAPWLHGFRSRLRRLDAARRAAFIEQFGRGPLRQLLPPIRAIALFGYYGDDALMRHFGYDADAVVARGRELRRVEARW